MVSHAKSARNFPDVDKQEHKRSYYMIYDMPNEALEYFKMDVYTVDKEVTSTSWMFDHHDIFHNSHVTDSLIINIYRVYLARIP
jgi:hypothetical protein